MKRAILKLKDSQVGTITIVIPKIRDYHKSFSSVVLTYDNGNTRNLEGQDLNKIVKDLDEAINSFYSN